MGIYGSSPQVSTTNTTTQMQYSPETEKAIADVAQQNADVAAQGMAISEREMEIGDELWQTYKQIFAPYEAEMVEVNRTLLPMMAELTGVQLDTMQQDLLGAGYIDEVMSDFELKELTPDQMNELSLPKEKEIEGLDLKDINLTDEQIAEIETSLRQDPPIITPEQKKIIDGLGLTEGQLLAAEKAVNAGEGLREALTEQQLRAKGLSTTTVKTIKDGMARGQTADEAYRTLQLKELGLSTAEIADVNSSLSSGKSMEDAYADAKLKKYGFDDREIQAIYEEMASGKKAPFTAIQDAQLKAYGLGDKEISQYHKDITDGKAPDEAFKYIMGKAAGYTDAQIAGEEPIPPGQRDIGRAIRTAQMAELDLTNEQIAEISRDIELNRPVKDLIRTLQKHGIDLAEDQIAELQRDIEKGQPLKDAIRTTQMKALGLTDDQIAEAQRDIEKGRPIKDAIRDLQLKETEAAKPAVEKFYKQAIEGVDAEKRMGEAASTVAQSFKTAEGNLRRSSARMGRNVTAGQIKDLAIEEAKVKAGSMIRAHRGAESENFGRLSTAMGVMTRNPVTPSQSVTGNMPAISTRDPNIPGVSSPSDPNIVGFDTGTSGPGTAGQYGGYSLSSPVNTAGGFMSDASNLRFSPNAQVLQTGSTSNAITTKEGGGGGAGEFLGSLAGIGLGAIAGPMGGAIGGAAAKKLFG